MRDWGLLFEGPNGGGTATQPAPGLLLRNQRPAESRDSRLSLVQVSGRADHRPRLGGENYQIGFVDVVGLPYRQTIAACGDMGYSLYKIRSGG